MGLQANAPHALCRLQGEHGSSGAHTNAAFVGDLTDHVAHICVGSPATSGFTRFALADI